MFSFSLSSRSALVLGLVVLGSMGLLVSGTTSCASAPDNKRFTEILQPDYPTYRTYVDAYLQRRCGTLDCHGQPGRAYRIYGFTGFRLYNLDAGLVSGQQPTTEEEVLANYQAAVALEPEEMSRLIATQGAEPNKLMLLRKPLKIERHKGGPAMAEDDVGYKCVVAWLRVRTVRPTSDGLDFETIPQEEREQLPLRAQQDCQEAQSFP
ncbi:MAG: hypothetical protein K0S65_6650 [Labilithrix sp.]|jgi:hypothetical protein|nr:hypothetical protein [Labilithrix sp.]